MRKNEGRCGESRKGGAVKEVKEDAVRAGMKGKSKGRNGRTLHRNGERCMWENKNKWKVS